MPALAARVAGARDVALGAYILPPGPVHDALIAAAHRGAHVDVVLPRAPWPDSTGELAGENAANARELRAAGAHVRLVGDDGHTTFHLKAAVCDGVAYLDDRNWTHSGRDLVVADDDPDAVALVRRSLAGHGGSVDGLATRKDRAQALELDLLAHAGAAPVTLETEAIGAGPLTAALAHHAASGAPTTLIVNGAESGRAHAVLSHLRGAGVEVRAGSSNAKLALVGDRAWIGSTNATFAGGSYGAQLDWGTVTADVSLVAAVKAALARDVGDSVATSDPARPPAAGRESSGRPG
ncbi:MAG TPA: phospholipase D-like domain-containing protein [Candidatus Sulfotelmatobacter sp.]|nr:phospholipase D-like domain-containing protein [Candidatus Sulfotelmatobacter sp.]